MDKIDILLERKSLQHIFNIRNNETISIHEWVELCYMEKRKNKLRLNLRINLNFYKFSFFKSKIPTFCRLQYE